MNLNLLIRERESDKLEKLPNVLSYLLLSYTIYPNFTVIFIAFIS